MAVKTKATILAEIASLLADNTAGDISASDMRTCLNDIVDSYGEELEVSGTLTDTQINLLDTTPIELIPAQGASTMIVITSSVTYRKTGTAYTTAGALKITHSGGDQIGEIVSTAMLTGTDGIILSKNEYDYPLLTFNENTAVEVNCDAAISGGTGDIDYYIKYKIIDL